MKLKDIADKLNLNPKDYAVDYFINIDALMKFLPTLSYEQALKKREQLRELGHLYCRNSYGVISIKDLMAYYFDDNKNEVGIDYIFPQAGERRKFRVKYYNKTTGETEIKTYRHHLDEELRAFLRMFVSFSEFSEDNLSAQTLEDYENLKKMLEM